MTTGAPAFGSVGCALHNVMFTQLSRYYQIPRWLGSAGYASSSKQIDYQNGYERALCGLSMALSGSNCVEMHGGAYAEITHHPIQSIMDDDIAGWIGKFIGGVPVNIETMALDLIKEVGPVPGEFLSKRHTRDHWKEAQFVPLVADRLTFPDWIKQGKKGCIDHARDKLEEILSVHKPTPLTESQAGKILDVLNEARQHYKKEGLMSESEDKQVEKVMNANMEYRNSIGLIQ
jgi:trimethylamine---corrinoid protein Co-methyltransferase